jgi:hypothetical protein
MWGKIIFFSFSSTSSWHLWCNSKEYGCCTSTLDWLNSSFSAKKTERGKFQN